MADHAIFYGRSADVGCGFSAPVLGHHNVTVAVFNRFSFAEVILGRMADEAVN